MPVCVVVDTDTDTDTHRVGQGIVVVVSWLVCAVRRVRTCKACSMTAREQLEMSVYTGGGGGGIRQPLAGPENLK